MQAKNEGAMSERDGLPSARIANVIWPANETESTVACARKVQRETLDNPEGVRLCSDWRENRISIMRYTRPAVPASKYEN